MKILDLKLVGIGPFVGSPHKPITIDFDNLSGTGMFLIHGETGSGKSTILDAIIFALYGSTRSETLNLKLRSQYVDSKTKSQVVLRFRQDGHTYRVTRTLSEKKDKTLEQKVLFETEITTLANGSTLLSYENLSGSKTADINASIKDLIGLNKEQFCQIAILPQGKFETFLFSNTKDKETVLKQIFSNTLYNDLVIEAEEKLKEIFDTNKKLVTTCIEDALSLRETLNKDKWSPQAFSLITNTLDALNEDSKYNISILEDLNPELFSATLRSIESEEIHKTKLVAACEERQKLKQKSYDNALTLFKAISDRKALLEEAAELENQKADIKISEEKILEHNLAQLVIGTIEGFTNTKNQLQKILSSYQKNKDSLIYLSKETGSYKIALPNFENINKLETLELTKLIELAKIRYEENDKNINRLLLTVEKENGLHTHRDRHIALSQKNYDQEIKNLEEKIAHIEKESIALSEEIDESQEAKIAILECEQKIKKVQDEIINLQESEKLFENLKSVQSVYEKQEAIVNTAKENYQNISEIFYASQASFLAAKLIPGQACQVCGSLEHPNKAMPSNTTVSKEELDQTKNVYEKEEEVLKNLTTRLIQTEAKYLEKQNALQNSNHNIEEITTELSLLQTKLINLKNLVTKMETNKSALTALQSAKDRETANIVTLKQKKSTNEIEIKNLETQIAQEQMQVAEEQGDFSSLNEKKNYLEKIKNIFKDLLYDLQLLLVTHDRYLTDLNDVQKKLETHNFSSIAEVRANTLLPDTLQDLNKKVSQYKEKMYRVQTLLADKNIQAAIGQPEPDLSKIQEDLDKETLLLKSLTVQLGNIESLASTARKQITSLETNWNLYKKNLDSYNRDGAILQALVGDDKHVSISRWFLGVRLDQVLAVANEFLDQITNRRYQLLRVNKKIGSTKRTDFGLDLTIIDNSKPNLQASRPADSLSGGEKFYFSLSLALALAQVVESESSKMKLETIFIDEGFGSLSASYLDEVISILDKLQNYSRSVGVISHVEELKIRIANQIEVCRHTKLNEGSYLKF